MAMPRSKFLGPMRYLFNGFVTLTHEQATFGYCGGVPADLFAELLVLAKVRNSDKRKL